LRVVHQHVEFTSESKRRLNHSFGIFELLTSPAQSPLPSPARLGNLVELFLTAAGYANHRSVSNEPLAIAVPKPVLLQ